MLEALDLTTNICNLTPDISMMPETLHQSAGAVNEIWRQGLLCYVYEAIYGLTSSERRVQECVRLTVSALRTMPWKQGVIWPVFMIGVQASDADDRKVVSASLNDVSLTLKSTNIMSTLVFLQKVWTDMDQKGTGISRWRQLMADSGTQLNLLL